MDENKILVKYESEHTILKHDTITLYIYHPTKGELVYKVDIEQTYKDSILLTNYELIEAHQKRAEARVDVEIPIEVRSIVVNNEIVELEKCISMKVCNLSANGMKLESHLDIPNKINLKIEIPIDSEIVEAFVQIVRKVKTEDVYSYGCRITNVYTCNIDKIRYFVFQTQIKQKSASKLRIS